ncbi:hypothetical protein GLYMA_05G227901v4 [Glycine max]|nr:hypothetical protein GLYMA_05G227901v4 [Glycine max]KAH1135852.1 hypothetical protein GYH30_013523 [Glycine max]
MLYYLTLGKFLALPQQNFLLFFFNILIVILIPSFSLAGMVRTRQIRSIFFISSVTEYYALKFIMFNHLNKLIMLEMPVRPIRGIIFDQADLYIFTEIKAPIQASKFGVVFIDGI